MALLVDVVGYVGMALLLGSFALLTLKKLQSDDWRYPLMNLIGAACVCINTSYHGAIPAAILNAAWFVIGIVGFVGARRRRAPEADPVAAGASAPAES